MAVREIAQIGDPVLREVCAPVEDPRAPEIAALVRDMTDTLDHFRASTGYGRGIAAPQVGVAKRVVVFRMPGEDAVAMINPAIVWRSEETFDVWDACFSYFTLFFVVNRCRRVKVRYRDVNGNEHIVDASDDLSELLQHEIEHLDGILAIDLVRDPRTFCSVKEYQRRHEGR